MYDQVVINSSGILFGSFLELAPVQDSQHLATWLCLKIGAPPKIQWFIIFFSQSPGNFGASQPLSTLSPNFIQFSWSGFDTPK